MNEHLNQLVRERLTARGVTWPLRCPVCKATTWQSDSFYGILRANKDGEDLLTPYVTLDCVACGLQLRFDADDLGISVDAT